MIDAALHMLFLLAAGHALADRPLQTDLMRAEKSRKSGGSKWPFGLAVHGLIHGGIVALVMEHFAGLWWLGIAETVAHMLIDDAKCMGRIGLRTDQALHGACKIVWTGIALAAI